MGKLADEDRRGNLTVENSIFKNTIQKGLTKTVSPLFLNGFNSELYA
jgi:hypothetical protein